MNKFDRIYELHKVLSNARYPVSKKKLQESLECSSATIDRTIEHYRLYLNAPLVYNRELDGYCLDKVNGEKFELPGLWFNKSELLALFTMHHLLENLDSGLFSESINPLKTLIQKILAEQGIEYGQISERVRLLSMAARKHSPEYFNRVVGATLQRKKLKMLYHGRGRDQITDRFVSPQRIVLYRDNWYLDGWCHLRKQLRQFSIDCIKELKATDQQAKNISKIELDEHYSKAYGIFAGKAHHTAKLKFNKKIARWVKDEKWHPDQQGQLEFDGSYTLEFPYGKTEELIMDILKYGPEVEVMGPKNLREQIRQRLQVAFEQY